VYCSKCGVNLAAGTCVLWLVWNANGNFRRRRWPVQLLPLLMSEDPLTRRMRTPLAWLFPGIYHAAVGDQRLCVLFLFSPRSPLETDVDLHWLVDGKATTVDIEKMIWGMGFEPTLAGQGNHRE